MPLISILSASGWIRIVSKLRRGLIIHRSQVGDR
jgi:hypothetical protein